MRRSGWWPILRISRSLFRSSYQSLYEGLWNPWKYLKVVIFKLLKVPEFCCSASQSLLGAWTFSDWKYYYTFLSIYHLQWMFGLGSGFSLPTSSVRQNFRRYFPTVLKRVLYLWQTKVLPWKDLENLAWILFSEMCTNSELNLAMSVVGLLIHSRDK